MRKRPQLFLIASALFVSVLALPILGSRAAATDRVVVVQPGDTLSQIALEHGVSVDLLVELNGLRDANRIYSGQRLVVERTPDAPPGGAATPAPSAATHTVAYGETLTGIALRYRTSIAAIAAANGIADPSYIRVGQVLIIPASQPAPLQPAPAAAPSSSHRVAYGETLTGIALRYRTSIAAIAAANGIADPSYIRVGQVLTIAGSAGAGAPPAASVAAPGGPGAVIPAAMADPVARRQDIARLIVAEAQRQGVPAAFALAVAWQESGWQPGVVSPAGAIGVMQLLPATGEWVGSVMLGQAVNLWDAGANVRAGVRLLKHYLDRYGGDRALALAAYYQGQTAADRHGVYPVTRPYIASILRLEAIFAG